MDLTAAAVVTGDEVPFPVEESSKSLPVNVSPSVKPAETVIKANDSDFELAQKAASGNMAAFERIYERYHRRTYSLCLRMTNSADRSRRFDAGSFYSAFSENRQLSRRIGFFDLAAPDDG